MTRQNEVARTETQNFLVSTVRLLDNHNFSGEGEPIHYETMAFTSPGDKWDGYQRRYSTEEQALAGHEETVDRIKSK